jgi:rhodanese-related sulfurtransferase
MIYKFYRPKRFKNTICKYYPMNVTSLPVDDVHAWRDRQVPHLLLDVRSHDEYGDVGIDGAMNVPIEELREDLEKLGLPKDKPIVCVCRTGRRSAMAAEFLRQQGYQAINMEGGMVDWTRFEYNAGIISEDEYEYAQKVLN